LECECHRERNSLTAVVCVLRHSNLNSWCPGCEEFVGVSGDCSNEGRELPVISI